MAGQELRLRPKRLGSGHCKGLHCLHSLLQSQQSVIVATTWDGVGIWLPRRRQAWQGSAHGYWWLWHDRVQQTLSSWGECGHPRRHWRSREGCGGVLIRRGGIRPCRQWLVGCLLEALCVHGVLTVVDGVVSAHPLPP